MADVDIDPFEEHESRPEDEHIPLDTVTPRESATWEPECKEGTSFGGKSLETLKYEALESFVKSLYKKLSGSNDEPLGMINYHNFDLRNGQLYYKDNVNPLATIKQVLRDFGVLVDRLGKDGLRDLGFDVPVGKVTAHQFMASYRARSQLPSTSDTTRADDIELQEFTEKASRSIKNLNQQFQEEPPRIYLCENS